MNEQFKVGEIAIVQNLPEPVAKFNGTECTVVEGLGQHENPLWPLIGPKSYMAYVVIDCDGNRRSAMPHMLRKKKPPQEDDANKVVSWDECAWKPPVTTPA